MQRRAKAKCGLKWIAKIYQWQKDRHTETHQCDAHLEQPEGSDLLGLKECAPIVRGKGRRIYRAWPLTENVGKMFAVFRPTCQDSETQTCHRRLFVAATGRHRRRPKFVRLDRRSTSNSLARNKNMRAFSLVQCV